MTVIPVTQINVVHGCDMISALAEASGFSVDQLLKNVVDSDVVTWGDAPFTLVALDTFVTAAFPEEHAAEKSPDPEVSLPAMHLIDEIYEHIENMLPSGVRIRPRTYVNMETLVA